MQKTKGKLPSFEFALPVTREAARACLPYIGAGNRMEADRSAVKAMRKVLKTMPIRGEVVIGEGERDSAPMLYIGEEVGMWGNEQVEYDIAVDPLEGTNLCAKATNGAWSVLAFGEKGGLFKAPDIYMEKIACGPEGRGVLDLSRNWEDNVKALAKVLGKKLSDMNVMILERERHKKLIQSLYKLGVRVYLIEDGDLSAGILTSWSAMGREKNFEGRLSVAQSMDLMLGTGGAPEGVLCASALKCLGGEFQGRLVFQNEKEKQRAQEMGVVTEPDKIYERDELVRSDVVFCATGVTDGPFLKGVSKWFPRQRGGRQKPEIKTDSLYMNSATGECSKVQSIYSKVK